MKNKDYPHIMKYMGSKSAIMDFLIECLNLSKTDEVYSILDLFSGSGSLAGALRGQTNVISNDIQVYSGILANIYCLNLDRDFDYSDFLVRLLIHAEEYQSIIIEKTDTRIRSIDYGEYFELDKFVEIEANQKALIKSRRYNSMKYHLFTKYYSGTYWSFKQCSWIDSIRYSIDTLDMSEVLRDVCLGSLMYAMSYSTQSTGHFAQYRDAKNESSMLNIQLYRRKSVKTLFVKKFKELVHYIKSDYNPYSKKCIATSHDYIVSLESCPENMIVYADPPYAFVHYSRFYHVIETMVKYDYPSVNYKGRYREDRHQSPFSKKTTVQEAFINLFDNIKKKNHSLVLSYSNTGMVSLDFIIKEAVSKFLNHKMSDHELSIVDFLLRSETDEFDFNTYFSYFLEKNKDYNIVVKFNSHVHSNMGRQGKKENEVLEMIIIIKRLKS